MNKYENNNLQKPEYLFHGSSKLLKIIEQRQAHDLNNNPDNEDFAVFLTSSFIVATAYAFQDKIKKLSEELNCQFEMGYDADNDKIFIKMNNVNIDDNIEGFIYVVPFNENYEHHGRSIQYKCHEDIKPIDVIKVKLSDYKNYYHINNSTKSK